MTCDQSSSALTSNNYPARLLPPATGKHKLATTCCVRRRTRSSQSCEVAISQQVMASRCPGAQGPGPTRNCFPPRTTNSKGTASQVTACQASVVDCVHSCMCKQHFLSAIGRMLRVGDNIDVGIPAVTSALRQPIRRHRTQCIFSSNVARPGSGLGQAARWKAGSTNYKLQALNASGCCSSAC